MKLFRFRHKLRDKYPSVQQEQADGPQSRQDTILIADKSYDDTASYATSNAGKSFISLSRLTEIQRKYLEEDQQLFAIMRRVEDAGSNINAFASKNVGSSEESYNSESPDGNYRGSGSGRVKGQTKKSAFLRRTMSKENLLGGGNRSSAPLPAASLPKWGILGALRDLTRPSHATPSTQDTKVLKDDSGLLQTERLIMNFSDDSEESEIGYYDTRKRDNNDSMNHEETKRELLRREGALFEPSHCSGDGLGSDHQLFADASFIDDDHLTGSKHIPEFTDHRGRSPSQKKIQAMEDPADHISLATRSTSKSSRESSLGNNSVDSTSCHYSLQEGLRSFFIGCTALAQNSGTRH
eukprot:CAMPEP_0198151856 /NCGR_PEP_ID=MMETSP1443-20131203/57437_1 /TAXON_ID=186043 /ORGANISM="Entomoneis sp., Strain CCMP2396" /LENGTH=351 /DNA_ID=CAMNT_0043817685 /DNA_START=69 /DNA_END=1124 /DNA_ORIENTATION=-